MQVLRSTHPPPKSFSGWLTTAQLTGAPLIYQPKQQNYVQANHQKPPPLFPHPPPSLHHQYSQHQTAYWLQDNQVTLAICTFCTSLSFYPCRQYQNPQFNMCLYITTTLCQFLKIPQNQVEVHFNDLKKLQSPRFTSVFHVWISKIINIKDIPQAIGWSTKKVALYPKTFRHLDIPSHPIPSCLLISSLTVRCN